MKNVSLQKRKFSLINYPGFLTLSSFPCQKRVSVRDENFSKFILGIKGDKETVMLRYTFKREKGREIFKCFSCGKECTYRLICRVCVSCWINADPNMREIESSNHSGNGRRTLPLQPPSKGGGAGQYNSSSQAGNFRLPQKGTQDQFYQLRDISVEIELSSCMWLKLHHRCPFWRG